jgi:hypothetical protein
MIGVFCDVPTKKRVILLSDDAAMTDLERMEHQKKCAENKSV